MDDKRKNKSEKKIILYLFFITIVLIYLSLFFIHYIIDNDEIKKSNIPDNNVNNIINDNQNNLNNINSNINNNRGNNNRGNNNRENNNKINNSINNNLNNDANNNVNNNTNNSLPNENIVDNNDRFRVVENQKDWNEIKELSIFKNRYFNDKSIIAPGISGIYNFTVENYFSSNIKYSMSFAEENNFKINLRFKLKRNGVYIVGNENDWVNCEELSQKDIYINSKSSDIYTLEWKWIDNNNDTEIGENDKSTYKIKVNVYAEEI